MNKNMLFLGVSLIAMTGAYFLDQFWFRKYVQQSVTPQVQEGFKQV
jgi:uncharacterized integral membrane protein